MRRLATVTLLTACAHPALAPRVTDEAWLAGTWQAGPDAFVSRWQPVGESLYGVVLPTSGGYEVNIVGTEDKRVTLWSTGDGQAATSLPLARASDRMLVFDDGATHERVTVTRSATGWTGVMTRPSSPEPIAFTVAPGKLDDAPDVAAADRAFDADTAARGADGWVAAFASDGGQWGKKGRIEGADAIRADIVNTLAAGALHWTPTASGLRGDIGFTLGTWTFTPKGAPAPAIHGSYCTIWKQVDGAWKVLFDVGRSDS